MRDTSKYDHWANGYNQYLASGASTKWEDDEPKRATITSRDSAEQSPKNRHFCNGSINTLQRATIKRQAKNWKATNQWAEEWAEVRIGWICWKFTTEGHRQRRGAEFCSFMRLKELRHTGRLRLVSCGVKCVTWVRDYFSCVGTPTSGTNLNISTRGNEAMCPPAQQGNISCYLSVP